MVLGEPDASGRRRPSVKPNSEFFMDVDVVIIALGTTPNPLISATNKVWKPLRMALWLQMRPMDKPVRKKFGQAEILSLVLPRSSAPWELGNELLQILINT